MSGWYVAHDVLGWPDEFEFVLPETTELNEAIAAAAGLPPDRARRRPAAEHSVYVEQPSPAGYRCRRSGAPFANVGPECPRTESATTTV